MAKIDVAGDVMTLSPLVSNYTIRANQAIAAIFFIE